MITAKEALDMTKGSSLDIPDGEIRQVMEECESIIRDRARLGITNVHFRCLDIEHATNADYDEKLRACAKARSLARALVDLGYETHVCSLEPWRVHIDWSKGGLAMGFEWIDEACDSEKPFTALMAADTGLRQNAEANLLALKRLLAYFKGINLKDKSEDARQVAVGIMEGLEKRIVETERALARDKENCHVNKKENEE